MDEILLQNHWANFNKTLHKNYLYEGKFSQIQGLFNCQNGDYDFFLLIYVMV